MALRITALWLWMVVWLVLQGERDCSAQDQENKFRVPFSNLYELLLNIANEGLQTGNIQDDLEDNFIWEYTPADGHQLLRQRLNSMSEIVQSNANSVWHLRKTILENFDPFLEDPAPPVPREQNCCYNIEKNEDNVFSTCVTTTNKNETGLAINAAPQIIEQLRYKQASYTTQYFGFFDGSMLMTRGEKLYDFSTCNSYDPRRRYWYVESEASYPRDVVVLVDQTSSVKHPTLLTATINRIIDCMTSSDRIVTVPSSEIAQNGRFRGNWWAEDMRAGLGVWMDGQEFLKDRLRQLIKNEVATETNRFDSHVDALHWAEDLLYAKPLYPLNVKRESVDIVVLVTGRQGFASWKGNKELSDTVNRLISSNVTLIVFTLPGAHEDYEEGTPRRTSEAATVHIRPIAREEHLDRANLARYFTSYRESQANAFEGLNQNEIIVTMPYLDAFGGSLIIGICLPLNINGTFWGSVCNDISVVNLFERLITVPEIEDAYAFAMDRYGRAMMHPLFPSPAKLSDHPLFIQMNKLEQHEEVLPILQDMVDGREGTKVVLREVIHNVGRPFQIELPNAISTSKANVQYFWGAVKGAMISMAVVLPQSTIVNYKCKTEEMCHAPHFQYHRWDMDATKPETCRFFGMEAAQGNALVKLAPSCFIDQVGYLLDENSETVAKLYDIFKYNHAKSDLLVGDELREGVALGERTEDYWRATANISQFIGARYLGTSEGVFVVYPGTQLKTQSFDPRLRPWYLRAVDSVARDPVVTVSPPYCDTFGSGLIVTVSMALKSPEPQRQVVAVAAGDFPSQYMNDNFVQRLPECEGKFICFLVDNSGYVIMHTKWQNAVPKHPTQCEIPDHGGHINVVEPVIGMKLVEMNILKRKGCYDYAELGLFLYWDIELPRWQTQVITQDFAMNHIPFTNLYLIVYEPFVNPPSGCVCPKSRVPGQPLRCRNTCENYCECPCVAAPNTAKCHDHGEDLLREKLPACWPRTRVSEEHPTAFDDRLKSLTPCKNYTCTAPDRRSCSKMGVGCFWYDEGCHDVNTL